MSIPAPPNPASRRISVPLWANEDDDFEVVEQNDGEVAPRTFSPGTYYVILLRNVWHGYPHAVGIRGETCLGSIKFIGPETLRFESWHDDGTSGEYCLRSLDIQGVVVEIHPLGDDGPAYELAVGDRGRGVINPFSVPLSSLN